jgi:ferredoxin
MCPQIFFMEQDGKAAAKDIEVPLDLEDVCRDTAEQCPVEAIMISE